MAIFSARRPRGESRPVLGMVKAAREVTRLRGARPVPRAEGAHGARKPARSVDVRLAARPQPPRTSSGTGRISATRGRGPEYLFVGGREMSRVVEIYGKDG